MYLGDLDDVLARAKETGVEKVQCVFLRENIL